MNKHKIIAFSISLIGVFFLPNCKKNTPSMVEEGEEVTFTHASNIKISDFDGYSVVEIRNPWDTVKSLQNLVLVEDRVDLPAELKDYTILKVPLENTVVYSSVHASLISELGADNRISGVCDRIFMVDSIIKEKINEGKIIDCGSSMNPNLEKIIRLKPDAVLLSPYETGGDEDKLTRFGVAIIECADYMEPTPLGRAEWMKFYGRLYGKGAEADSLFEVTEKEYIELRDRATGSDSKPTVLFDKVYGQSWSVPGGNSTIGTLIDDAGGSNPFSRYAVAGSVNLSPEKVMYEAGDADIWIIRYANIPLTMKSLKEERPIYSRFGAYKRGAVYGSETLSTNIFDDLAFHPQWVLKDLIRVTHPEIAPKEGKVYFKKLNNEI